MATETSERLKLEYVMADGGSFSYSVNSVDTDAEAADILTFANSMITNGDIFVKVPMTLKSAKLITTTTTDVENA